MGSSNEPTTSDAIRALPVLTPSRYRPSTGWSDAGPVILGFMRLTRASLLWSDVVVYNAFDTTKSSERSLKIVAGATRDQRSFEVERSQSLADLTESQFSQHTGEVGQGVRDFVSALRAGIVVSNAFETPFSVDVLPVFDARPRSELSDARRQRAVEGGLAAALVASLPAFPDARLDTLLDIRDRLAPARRLFRSAIADLAEHVTADLEAGAHEVDALAAARRRVVDPARAEIESELSSLRAWPTLLRVASDRVALAGTGTAVSLAVGGPRLLAPALATLGGVGPVSAVLRELSARNERRREVSVRPYWLLHTADSRLRRAKAVRSRRATG